MSSQWEMSFDAQNNCLQLNFTYMLTILPSKRNFAANYTFYHFITNVPSSAYDITTNSIQSNLTLLVISLLILSRFVVLESFADSTKTLEFLEARRAIYIEPKNALNIALHGNVLVLHGLLVQAGDVVPLQHVAFWAVVHRGFVWDIHLNQWLGLSLSF